MMRYTGRPGIPAGTGARRIVRTFYANTSTGVAEGIEPTPACAGEPHLSACTAQAGADRSILCSERMWRKTFPAQGRGERHLKALNAL
ncbi:MAG: hypothetical protein DRH10_06175 [Deltaproteobacteria bacterium]|nr:MAG: hypothetical protein DRH10_06175 [Deltaproteobacteria bacterium]